MQFAQRNLITCKLCNKRIKEFLFVFNTIFRKQNNNATYISSYTSKVLLFIRMRCREPTMIVLLYFHTLK